MRSLLYGIILALIVGGGLWFVFGRGDGGFNIPKGGEAVPFESEEVVQDPSGQEGEETKTKEETPAAKEAASHIIRRDPSNRQVFVTEEQKHSIPLEEIRQGIPFGDPRDAIPSIDNPKFISIKEADSILNSDDVGLGIEIKGEARFYPYQILVFHEIVNDTIQGEPVLVTYCPLCATGVAFERGVQGEVQEFGVSGFLWESNLLMYNRAGQRSSNLETQSLWSQVLGEAVVGPHTPERLAIVPADTTKYSDWKKAHPNTIILSQDTGEQRDYGRDPYGNYYTEEGLIFGVNNEDSRLHQKAFVLGVEHEGEFKAYLEEAIPEGETKDTFAGEIVTIEKTSEGEVRMFIGQEKTPLPYIGGFWFSWATVHPETELYK